MEYNINNKYIILMQQRIQTALPQIINRIEIGRLKNITKDYLILESGRRVKKSLIKRAIDISNIYFMHTQFFIDGIEDALI